MRNKLLRGQHGATHPAWSPDTAQTGNRGQIHQDNAKCFADTCNSSLQAPEVRNKWGNMFTVHIVDFSFGVGDTEIQTAAHVIWTMCAEEELR